MPSLLWRSLTTIPCGCAPSRSCMIRRRASEPMAARTSAKRRTLPTTDCGLMFPCQNTTMLYRPQAVLRDLGLPRLLQCLLARLAQEQPGLPGQHDCRTDWISSRDRIVYSDAMIHTQARRAVVTERHGRPLETAAGTLIAHHGSSSRLCRRILQSLPSPASSPAVSSVPQP